MITALHSDASQGTDNLTVPLEELVLQQAAKTGEIDSIKQDIELIKKTIEKE